MKKRARAKIKWLSPEEGGRKKPPMGPTGTEYFAPSHFENDIVFWPKHTWSLVVQFDEPSTGSLEIMAVVWFLFPDAPHDFLSEGNRFELLEGNQIIAKGEIGYISFAYIGIRISLFCSFQCDL